MANCFSSDLQEFSAWEHYSTLQLNPDEASSFYLNGYNPFSLHIPPWPIPFEGFAEGRATSSSKSHSEVEKRRRDRINAQLATLRRLIPRSEKMDKAALLGSVVEHIKVMKSKVTEISKVITIPTDKDEVPIDEHPSSSILDETTVNIHLHKASVCCDDRSGLFSELNRALKSLRLTVMHADVTSLGSRIKSIFILSVGGGICMDTLKQSLRVVLCRIAASCSNSGSIYRMKSRRRSFFLPSILNDFNC